MIQTAVKHGAMLGGGEEVILAIDFKTMTLPHSRNFDEILNSANIIRRFDPSPRMAHSERRAWSAQVQLEFAQLVFTKQELHHWNNGSHPNGAQYITAENSLYQKDGRYRHNLNPYMSNILVAADQIQCFKQKVDRTAINAEYVCLIQIHAFGGPSIALQVNQAEILPPPYVQNLVLNPNIKKLVIDATHDRDALYNSVVSASLGREQWCL